MGCQELVLELYVLTSAAGNQSPSQKNLLQSKPKMTKGHRNYSGKKEGRDRLLDPSKGHQLPCI
jgi:hypothetical protein